MNDILPLSIILAICIIATLRECRISAKTKRQIREREYEMRSYERYLESSRKQIAETARSAEEAQMGADRP